jgi:uncharacterized iron-regulated membrane protein
MTLRTLIFWPHLIAGVIAGSIVLLMSVTGVILTYERQLIAWSDSGYRSNPSPGATQLSPESLLARLRRDRPDIEVTTLTFASDPTAPVSVAVGRETVYADAYTGALVGEATQGMRRFMSEMRAWHRWIAVEGEGRPIARAITGWSNAIFLFIVASGFYLWFPRKWTWPHIRTVTLFSGKLRGKARDFNWHNVIGFWSAVPLFIVVLTAMPISFPWANALVYRAVGEEPPQQGGRGGGGGREGGAAANAGGREGGARANGGERNGGGDGRERRAEEPPSVAGLDALLTVAERQVPGWRTINMRIPASERVPVVFAIDKGDGGQPQHRSTLTLDRASAAVVSYEAFSDQSLGRQLRSISRFAHTGEVLGLPGQTIAGLVTGGAVVLVWTGIALTVRRFRAWLGRRAKSEVETVEEQVARASNAPRIQPAGHGSSVLETR